MFDENDTVITEINDTLDTQAYRNKGRREDWERKMGIDKKGTAIYAPPTFPLGALIELAIATGHAVWKEDDGSYRIEHCSILAKQAG